MAAKKAVKFDLEHAQKASMAKMNKIHDQLAEYFLEQLMSGLEISSGTLAAANAFLKNNNVSVDLSEAKPMQNLSYRIADLIKEASEAEA